MTARQYWQVWTRPRDDEWMPWGEPFDDWDAAAELWAIATTEGLITLFDWSLAPFGLPPRGPEVL